LNGQPPRKSIWKKFGRELLEILPLMPTDSSPGSEKAVQNLTRFPESGEILQHKEGERLREIYVRSYRVIFRVRENSVRVIAVIHAARDFHLFEEDER